MNGTTAKRILIALARKMSFDSIKRVNAPHGRNGYMLELVGKTSVHLAARPIGATDAYYSYDISTSSKWNKILEALAGKEIIAYGYYHKPIVVHSVEQLAIDLELEGWLKNI